MRRLFVAILLALSCVYGQAQSQDCASMMRQALEITDFNQPIDALAEQFNSEAFMQQAAGGNQDPEFTKVFLPIVQKHFNAQEMKKELEGRMTDHCNSQQMALTLQQLQSPIMTQMLRLDAEAKTPEGKQRLQRYIRAMKVAPPSDTRVSQLQAFDERTGITTFAMDSMVAAMRGMMTGAGAPTEVISQIDSRRAELKVQFQNNLLPAMASAYRNVSAADLEAYAKELNTQPLKGFYDQGHKAFVVMAETRCTAIGKDLKAAMLAKQK
jgi:hypothetical protein